ncbi:MAG: pyruvate dehydrogenase complex dihydrolipoamide acetyltransferase [Rhodospirillales bacterium]|nr:pyruvate dehydrogenase complex dihydrolipoamide acetyltransferase [Rhodospirillales bacterium]
MATNILMPALSPTMTEGTLARWLKHEGDTVRAGDVIAEIETDKATMEVEAVDEGVLGRILVADGTQGVKVNDPIAILVEPGEKLPPPGAPAMPVPAVVPAAPAQAAAPPAPAAAHVPAAPPAPAAAADAGRIVASPLARRMARQAGLDLANVTGSGPNGRIVRADVEAALARPAAAASPAAKPAAPTSAPTPVSAAGLAAHTLVPHSTMRRVIARRLSEAKATIPHFYVSVDVELDALLAMRTKLNAKSAGEGPGAFRLSVNDFIVKASAIALRRVPGVNASWTDDGIALYEDVDISVAVSIPDGLITPIVRQADRKGLAAISNEMKDLADRAKSGKLKPDEFQGGGFSISNMGMYGVSSFSAIINPPQAAILAVSAGEKRAVVHGDQIEIATVMTCTLSVDHRVIDGALGARWLAAFKRIVEDPLSLML